MRSATGRYHITIVEILLYFSEIPKVASAGSTGSTEAILFLALFLFLLFLTPGP
jgi:hypothetical protein